jgi:hypothetical protein
MFLRRLGLYCALALSPFAFLAGCSPTAGLGSTSATPQSIIGYPMPSGLQTSTPIPLANAQRGAQDISAWPGISSLVGSALGVAAFPVGTSPMPSSTPVPITLSNNRAR